MNIADIRTRYADLFKYNCAVIARAPGRVNLIGDHTDYNDGFVLPIAIQRETVAAAALRADGVVRVFSSQLDKMESWSAAAWKRDKHAHWSSYIAGVAERLRARGVDLSGFDLLVDSDVPIGGGLSSSAALEVATALTLDRATGAGLASEDLIDLCREAEHEYAGVPCGLMDQTVSLLARAGAALLLDCRTRSVKHIPCNLGEHAFFVVDSGVRHELAAGEYAKRREQCTRAVEHFARIAPGVRALRDVTPELLGREAAKLDGVIVARARHVIGENERVIAAAAALADGNLEELGRLMNESHCSLRDDYQVSCRELDQLVECLVGVAGVLGARMTGGGFGGSVVFLGRIDAAERVARALSDARILPPTQAPEPLRCEASAGATTQLV